MTGSDELWRDGGVAQRNLILLDSEFMSDCTFVVGIEIENKKRFRCHKFILSQGSAVFYAMFNGELQEKGEVKVEDIEPQHFRKMLEFIHSDNTELENAETALNVCYAAHKYMINTLVLKCIDIIKDNLDPDNVCSVFEFARLIDNADLKAESLQYLQTNTYDVFKSAAFLDASKATLLTLVSQDHLCITSEVQVFSACVRWAEAQQRKQFHNLTLREVLGFHVWRSIRFLTMTSKEFAIIVVSSKMLRLKEERDILCCLATGARNIPPGFSDSKKKRYICFMGQEQRSK